MPLQYTCPEADCRFAVRADTEYEVFDHAETHAQAHHQVWLAGRELREHVVES